MDSGPATVIVSRPAHPSVDRVVAALRRLLPRLKVRDGAPRAPADLLVPGVATLAFVVLPAGQLAAPGGLAAALERLAAARAAFAQCFALADAPVADLAELQLRMPEGAPPLLLAPSPAAAAAAVLEVRRELAPERRRLAQDFLDALAAPPELQACARAMAAALPDPQAQGGTVLERVLWSSSSPSGVVTGPARSAAARS